MPRSRSFTTVRTGRVWMTETVFLLTLGLILPTPALSHIVSADMKRLGYPDLTF